MNRKRRQPPIEDNAAKLSRELAEMVVLGPSNQGVSKKSKTKSPDVKLKKQVKVKEEEVEPPLKIKQEPRTATPPASISTPITMSLVDFSLALSLVFGGCCRLVQTHIYINYSSNILQ